jgi:uncharacterized membrane protein
MKANRRKRHRFALLRIVRARPRLFICGAISVVVPVILAFLTSWRPATRLLAGWDIGVALYLAVVVQMMRRSDIRRIRRRAAQQDEGQFTILVLTVAAALASLAAIFVHFGSSAINGSRQPISLTLPALTILLSWAFIHTMFALHYAHEFYDETASGGLTFPGDREPDYWDFVYFSFVIGMTSQVSDVSITSKQIRRTVAAHGVVSFVFNAALLALTVNLAASAISVPDSTPAYP